MLFSNLTVVALHSLRHNFVAGLNRSTATKISFGHVPPTVMIHSKTCSFQQNYSSTSANHRIQNAWYGFPTKSRTKKTSKQLKQLQVPVEHMSELFFSTFFTEVLTYKSPHLSLRNQFQHWTFLHPPFFVGVSFEYRLFLGVYLDVFENSGGSPKSSVLKGFQLFHHPFWGTLFLETPIQSTVLL